ncbi:MAG TPA: HD domain-containing phosphohydrolase [Patescibacteria group bacterium]|nr:HD domain-containing phosphohydrolase [Patescibacteria group bacterium]
METKMIPVNELQPGNVLSDQVMTLTGKVLLGKEVVLSERTISLLTMWDISHVYIYGETEAVTPPAPMVANNEDVLKNFMSFFSDYDTVVANASQSFDFVRNQKKIPVQELKDTSFSVYSSVLNSGPAVLEYLLISDYKLADTVSRHSVMVAFICGIIGHQMKLAENELKNLTLAALLHDIGKLVTGKEDVTGPEKHVITGGALLKDVGAIPPEIILSVLQHHECMDGSGFPRGTEGNKIHLFARIIAVANLFHTEAYHDEYSNPFPVLDLLSKEMFGKLDPAVCHPFIRQIRDSLINNTVVLSDGRCAEVIFFHPNNSGYPIIRTDDNQIIDLSSANNVRILHLSIPEYMAL